MDSLTHVYFAHKLLTMTSCNTSASVCSLFPQIDRRPAYFHRMYGHPFFQIARLSRIGMKVYHEGVIPEEMKGRYEWQRFLDERPRMISFVQEFQKETGTDIMLFNPDILSVILAYVSHTYQDIFNNPMQAFLPYHPFPSGQWQLWLELGSIDFRTMLYRPENISAFRKEFFSSSIWETSLDPVALIQGMIVRTALASCSEVPRHLIEATVESLQLEYKPSPSQIEDALQFLSTHEDLLAQLMRKFSVGLDTVIPASTPVAS